MTELQIECFLEVARCLNFTKAARTLYISQSNISRQIASLEEEWKIVLFARNTKTVKLTPQGKFLAEKMENLVGEWETAMAQARNSVRNYSGSVTIGCQDHLTCNTYLSQMLYDFRKVNPGIHIVKERNVQKKLIQGLKNDYYDAILVAGHDIRDLQRIEKLTLFHLRMGLVVHKSHPLFLKQNATLEDFKNSAFLRYKPSRIDLEDDHLTQICDSFGFRPKIIAEFSDFDEFLLAIEMGEGVALLLEETEANSNRNLRFIPIEGDVQQLDMPIQLVRKEKNRNEALQEVFQYAQQYAVLLSANK